MTAIAYRDGILAGDTLWGDGGLKTYDSKVSKYRGHLVGMCGNDVPSVADIIKWFFWDKADVKRKTEFEKVDFQLLVIDPNGVIWVCDNRGMMHKVKSEFWAIGTGAHVCLGAMEVGANAKEAVKAAIKWADGCGGTVITKRL